MKVKLGILCFTLTVMIVVTGLQLRSADQPASDPAKAVMREKLELAQQVLEGLTTENFELIISKASRLSAMSKGSHWRVVQNPEYDHHSIAFRRHTDTLIRAAREMNLDAATLAYVRVTMSCVDCHKLVRGKVLGSTLPAIPPALAAAIP